MWNLSSLGNCTCVCPVETGTYAWIFVDVSISFPSTKLRPPVVCKVMILAQGSGRWRAAQCCMEQLNLLMDQSFCDVWNIRQLFWNRLGVNRRREKSLSKKNIPKISRCDISQTFLYEFWDLAENVLSLRLIAFKRVRRDSCRPSEWFGTSLFLQMY